MDRFDETKKKLKKYYRQYPLLCSVDDITKTYVDEEIPARVEIYNSTMGYIESLVVEYNIPKEVKDEYREAFRILATGMLTGGELYNRFETAELVNGNETPPLRI